MILFSAGEPSPLQLGLVAVTISLDTFAAAIALGTRLRRQHWVRVALVFAMVGGIAPLFGIVLGSVASEMASQIASGLGVLVLAALGGWFLHSAVTGRKDASQAFPGMGRSVEEARASEGDASIATGPLLILALGLSSDNVLVGLGLGLQGNVPAVLGGVTAISVFGATLTGLALGALGLVWFGRGAVAMAGCLLLGLAIAFLVGGG